MSVLHGIHAAPGISEWLLPLTLVAGVGTVLIARWLGRLLRGGPTDHDEPI